MNLVIGSDKKLLDCLANFCLNKFQVKKKVQFERSFTVIKSLLVADQYRLRKSSVC